ncbi:MAG: DUF3347 domain-containing protein [Planctomycetes bacterium]|nr:DUF3347 domain-containing protein [Planctomycetota bacterium]
MSIFYLFIGMMLFDGESTETTKDYVCNKEISISDSKASKEFKKIQFYFCSKDDLNKFTDNQDVYYKEMSKDYDRFINEILKHYFEINLSLTSDKTDGIQNHAKQISLNSQIASRLEPDINTKTLKQYKDLLTNISKTSGQLAKEVFTCEMHLEISLQEPGKCPVCGMKLTKTQPDIKIAREKFGVLSNHLIAYHNEIGKKHSPSRNLHVFHCSMANKSWLQQGKESAKNPYYGKNMLNCGKLVKESSNSDNTSFANPNPGKCPVTNEGIDKNITYTHNNKTYSFCCEMCIKKFKANPEKYLNKQTDDENEHGKHGNNCCGDDH